jgi:formylglycine-generating enzyme required for sulfatase activity
LSSRNFILVTAVLALVVGACASPPNLVPTESPPTLVSPSPVLPTDVSTLVPVVLAGPQAGSSMAWVDGSVLMYVPAGDFTMGSGASDAPQRTVALDGYWIYQTEVTKSMYAYCVSIGACAPPAQANIVQEYQNPFYSNYPMVAVTWDMASNYCAWAGGGLPSEAQWEKAARGASGAQYPWGDDDPDCSLGNFNGCVGALTDSTAFPDSASPFGVLDMAGNVFEWVNDYYAESYFSSAPAVNPTGPESGEFRVVRGSSFESPASQAAVTIRRPGANAFSSHDLGFRCVIQQPQPLAPMCQLPSYIPSGELPVDSCQTPEAKIAADYCENKRPYTRLELSQGATWNVRTVDTTCAEATVDGVRQLTCTGSDSTIGQVTVCNPACGSAPDITQMDPVCGTGYSLDSSTGNCVYTPASRQPELAGCPAGYLMVERDGQNTCVPGPGRDGNCPDGMYFDSLYGACASVAGGADVPYGIDQPELAEVSFAGCLPGYEYDPSFQCCQPLTGGVYPGCPLGTRYEAALQTCVPGDNQLNATGCVTLLFELPQCVEPYQVNLCAKIQTETTCIRNKVNGCQWFEDQGGCKYVP